MGFWNSLFNSGKQIEYSANARGKFADNSWSDKRHKKISDKYFPQMHKIEEDWSILYNFKEYYGQRADKLEQNCKENIQLYKEMAQIEKLYNETPPPNAPAFKRLAMLYEKQGHFEKAASVCYEALEVGAWGDGMRSRLARMIKKAGREPSAKERALIDQ